MSPKTPQRIVCLSAEAADWCYRIGAWNQVAGVTAFFQQPSGVPAKPCVSGFSSANLNKIAKLAPDLIITFSDVQAPLAAELVRRGFLVVATNQRTLEEIENTLALLARIVGRERQGERWLKKFRKRLAPVKEARHRPRVYFEEWNGPLICGIAWVSELIERAGGDDVFARMRSERAAKARVVSPGQILRADPEIILASWCGKPVQTVQIAMRPGWHNLSAVQQHNIREIPGDDILQPGFRLVHGYEKMKELFKRARRHQRQAETV